MEAIVIRSRNTAAIVIVGALLVVGFGFLLARVLWAGIPIVLAAMATAYLVGRQAVIFYDGGVVVRTPFGSNRWRWSKVASFDVAERATEAVPVRTLRMHLNDGEEVWLTLCRDPDKSLVQQVNREAKARRA